MIPHLTYIIISKKEVAFFLMFLYNVKACYFTSNFLARRECGT